MKATEQVITIAVALPFDEAWAYAQFVKRTGRSDYRGFAKNRDEAYEMLYAGERLRDALIAAGVAPR